ncbi:hypothetical protein P7M25_25660, partial [Vibrio parahaemolyticus]|nr:hypothetical protein [Vibrio parahaemolyticus]
LLDEKIKEEKDKKIRNELKKQRKEIKRNKNKHEYIVSLKDFERKEKDFLKALKKESKDYRNTLKDEKTSRRVKNLKVKLFESEKKLNFYKDYINLSYEAEFECEKARLETIHLPNIIEFLTVGQDELRTAKEEKKELKNLDESNLKKEFKEFKKAQKEFLKKEKLRIKKLRKEGLISKKAEENALIELKKKYVNALEIKRRESKKFSNKEFIKSKKYDLKKGLNTMIKVMEA